jgi:SAM-dependent methyltransferase
MIERVRRKAASASLRNVKFLKAGLGDGQLPEGCFDRAVLSTVLGEIPDRLSAMREIYSALKPGGFLLVNEVIGDPHYQSLAKVEALAKQAGFHPSTVHGGRMAFSVKLGKPMNQTRTQEKETSYNLGNTYSQDMANTFSGSRWTMPLKDVTLDQRNTGIPAFKPLLDFLFALGLQPGYQPRNLAKTI